MEEFPSKSLEVFVTSGSDLWTFLKPSSLSKDTLWSIILLVGPGTPGAGFITSSKVHWINQGEGQVARCDCSLGGRFILDSPPGKFNEHNP